MSRTTALLAAFALLVSAGCAAIQKSDATDTERTLAAAGFQMKFASTPEQIAKAEALPQRKLTPSPGPDGKNRFVWADATFCKCIYVGTEAAYDRYQKLAVNQQIGGERGGRLDELGRLRRMGTLVLTLIRNT